MVLFVFDSDADTDPDTDAYGKDRPVGFLVSPCRIGSTMPMASFSVSRSQSGSGSIPMDTLRLVPPLSRRDFSR